MAQIKFAAGEFEIETWTEGHPMWMTLTWRSGSREERMKFHHSELKNLAFVIDRMLAQARAKMPDFYKHEFD